MSILHALRTSPRRRSWHTKSRGEPQNWSPSQGRRAIRDLHLLLLLLFLTSCGRQALGLISRKGIAATIASAGRNSKPATAASSAVQAAANFSEATLAGLPSIVEQRIDLFALDVKGSSLEAACTKCLDPKSTLGHASGYFRLKNKPTTRLFYFYFRSRKGKYNTDPVVLWLTGGPGCASSFAAFFENGPYTINKDNRTLSWSPYGWDRVSNIIFLDQPVGTGFSYTTNPQDYVNDGTGVAEDAYDFLQAFYKVHPELVKRPFFITGESYAGKYIPVIARRILQGNRQKATIRINLKGVAMGNPWTDPLRQYGAYADFCHINNLMSQATRKAFNAAFQKSCAPALRLCARKGIDACSAAAYKCDAFYSDVSNKCGSGNLNSYDIRQECNPAFYPDCYDWSALDKFMALAAVRKTLKIPAGVPFESCNNAVFADFNGDEAVSVGDIIPQLLSAKVSVLVYVGDKDLICNWLGNWRWVYSLKWSGRVRFQASKKTRFKSRSGSILGDYNQWGPLLFLKVYNAGHMVPRDQPRAGLDMIYSFTRKANLRNPFLK